MAHRKIIVTGGAGFIGSNLVRKLNQQGLTDIVIVDNLGTATKWNNLIGLKYLDYFHKQEFIENIKCDETWQNVTTVFHLGACSSTVETNADYLMENNFKYSCKVATECLNRGIRFIYASSAATYGLGENGYDDNHDLLDTLKPLNMYGYSKHLFDQWCKSKGYLDKVCGIKFFNVYGPHESHKGGQSSLIPRAKQQLLDTGSIKLFKSITSKYKDGEQLRDFIYVDDCSDVMWWLANNKKINGIFNLGTGKAQTWNNLAAATAAALNKECKIEYIPMPEHLVKQYQDYTQANMQKLTNAGCPVKFRDLFDGVKAYINNDK